MISKNKIKKDKEEKAMLTYTEGKYEESLDKENFVNFNDF